MLYKSEENSSCVLSADYFIIKTCVDGEAQIEKTMVVNTLTPAVMKNNQRHSDKLLSS